MQLMINGQTVEFSAGERYIDVIRKAGLEKGALGVMVKGETCSLNAVAEESAQVKILTFADEEGRRIYERTLQFVLTVASRRIFPEMRLRLEHSFGEGVYVHAGDDVITPDMAGKIRAEMRAIMAEDAPITREIFSVEDARMYFREMGREDILGLLKYRAGNEIPLYSLHGMREYFYGEMAPSAGFVPVFEILPYYPGMVMMLPSQENPDMAAKFRDMPKLARTFSQSAKWNAILDVSNAADLNEMGERRHLREFIRVNEALQEKSVQKIADEAKASGARVILIAGPSSSGKTTFSHRLLIALKVLGMRPVKISVDDYYVNREMVPLEPDGTRDLEKIDILDLELLNDHLLKLIQGKAIQAPEYDFVEGMRKKQTHPVSVEEGQPIIIEGIHALNDQLTWAVPREMKFKIYVSALTTINLDDHNRIRTTDARLLRRMVRDYLFRGTSPEETLDMWDSVRRGEEKYIFPYQEQADAMFNTSLVYELAIMKKYVYPMLLAITPDRPCYTRARRLVKFLNYFRTTDVEDEIPVNSILREFIGGCCFYREDD